MLDFFKLQNSKQIKLPSHRSFGVLFLLVFVALAGYGELKDWPLVAIVVLCLTSIILAVVTILTPMTLAPLNRAWFSLGQLMGKIVSPLVMGTIFYLLVTPVALITRALGRDDLKIRPRDVSSYWVDRDAHIRDSSFKHQF